MPFVARALLRAQGEVGQHIRSAAEDGLELRMASHPLE